MPDARWLLRTTRQSSSSSAAFARANAGSANAGVMLHRERREREREKTSVHSGGESMRCFAASGGEKRAIGERGRPVSSQKRTAAKQSCNRVYRPGAGWLALSLSLSPFPPRDRRYQCALGLLAPISPSLFFSRSTHTLKIAEKYFPTKYFSTD